MKPYLNLALALGVTIAQCILPASAQNNPLREAYFGETHELGVAPPSDVPPTVQERAWTSPIWFSPTEEARKTSEPGLTISDLKQKGAVALDDAHLKDLVVDKTISVRNTVTGQRFDIFYGIDGRRLIMSVDRKQLPPSEVGDVLHSGELGSPAE